MAVSCSSYYRTYDPSMTRAIGRLVNSRLPDAICSLDSFGVVKRVYSNAPQFLGYNKCEIVGQKISLLMPCLDPSLLRRRTNQNSGAPRRRGRRRPFIVRAMAKDGVKQTLKVFIRIVQNHHSCLFKLFVYRQGADTRISAAGELVSDAELRNRRLASLAAWNFSDAREINQTLTSAGNFAYAAAAIVNGRRDQSPQIVEGYLNSAMRQIERAGRINKALLKSLHQVTRLLPDMRLNDVVREACDTAISDLPCRRITKSLDLSSQLPRVIFDPKQIKRVMVILLTSTLRRFGRGDACSVRISTRHENASTVLVEIGARCSSLPDGALRGTDMAGGGLLRRGQQNALINDCDEIISQHGGRLFVRTDPSREITYQFSLPGLDISNE